MQNEKEIKGLIYVIARQSLAPFYEVKNNGLVYSTFCGDRLFPLLLNEILEKYKLVEIFIFMPRRVRWIFYLRFKNGKITGRIRFMIEAYQYQIFELR